MSLTKILITFLLFVLISPSVSASVHLDPVIRKSPADLTYTFGTTGNELIWAFDAHESADDPSKYVVTIDNVIHIDHNFVSWQDNVDIVVNVDGLNVGSHEVKIVANDTGSDALQAGPATDIATVTVTADPSNTETTVSTTATADTEIASTTTTPSSTSTSDANAFPITLLSLIVAMAIGIPILKIKDYRR